LKFKVSPDFQDDKNKETIEGNDTAVEKDAEIIVIEDSKGKAMVENKTNEKPTKGLTKRDRLYQAAVKGNKEKDYFELSKQLIQEFGLDEKACSPSIWKTDEKGKRTYKVGCITFEGKIMRNILPNKENPKGGK